ncbi:MAG: DNA repair protein RadC [Lachnospiraceae bacterium]|nr:DNA repair protein RadC [Lachnospiraceae bacterium]
MYEIKENGTIHVLPYDRFLQGGPSAVSDEELLAIILRTGTNGEDALSVACHVRELCGQQGLLGLHHLTLDQLMSVRGIGQVKAVKLKAIAELATRIAAARVEKDVCLQTAGAVAEAYMERMRHLEREQTLVVFLDGADHRIGDAVLSEGSLTETQIFIREIYRLALQMNAASIILLHNHPSGNPRPSRQDMLITARLHEASDYMEIPLLDHIIIGDNRYYSFREKGEL